MAKSFNEIGKKAEALLEQGKEADQRLQNCQARVTSFTSIVAAARRQLAATSETNEDGKPSGDVAQARAQLNMAENMLAASQRALSSAQGDANRVRQQKNAKVQDIERHNQVERSNLEKLRRLRSEAFGADSAALTEGMARRLNEAEDIRVKLLRSMGIEASPNHVAEGVPDATDAGWQGGGFAAIDTHGEAQSYRGGRETAGALAGKGLGAPVGGGLSGLFDRILHGGRGNDGTHTGPFAASVDGKKYTNVNELSDDLFRYTEDYVVNAEKYNQPMRNHLTTPEVEHFRALVNSHQVTEDSVFFRRASLRDLGSKLANIPIEQLAGQYYQFEGIMSVAKKDGFAGSHNNGMDATFEVHVPAGTPGLDLTQVNYYQQAMFDSPLCYIESVTEKKDSNSVLFAVRVLSAGTDLNQAAQLNQAAELNQVNDHASLQKYLDARYGFKLDRSVADLNFDTVKSAVEGVETVIREYPEVGRLLESGITSDSGVMSCVGDTISFNPNYFSDDQKLHEICKDMSDRGFWVSNTSVTSIGVHEAAHGVEWALIQANRQYKSKAERIYAWNNCTEATRIVRDACANIKNTKYGQGNTSTELIRSISTYAMQNNSETMAEAFADVYANGDNAKPLSKEIKRLTRLFMDQYKGGA